MKKFIASITSVLLAIATVAFTVENHKETISSTRSHVCIYYVYSGVGNHCDIASYMIQTTKPAQCAGNSRLCWIKVCDVDHDNDIDQDDFDATVDVLDIDNDCSLDDETEQSGILEKRL